MTSRKPPVTYNESTRVAYAYARVSDAKQVQSGLSLEAQESEAKAYLALLQNRRASEGKPPFIWDDNRSLYVDKAVSASKVPFLRRDAGAILNARLKPGDIVIITKLDRAFRSLADMLKIVYEVWAPQEIGLHLLQMNMDFSTPIGKLVLSNLAMIGEFESAMKRERLLAANAVRRERGQKMGRRVAYGFKQQGKMLIACPHERACLAIALHLQRQGITVQKLGIELRKMKLFRSHGGEWMFNNKREFLATCCKLKIEACPVYVLRDIPEGTERPL